MIRLDRYCVWILIFGIILLLPSLRVLSFIDELMAVMFAMIALFDAVVTGNWKRYGALWTVIGIMTFYAIYSITFLKYNTPTYVMIDWLIELKPFIPFVVMMAIRPKFTQGERTIIRVMCIINAIGAFMIMLLPYGVMGALITHISYGGQAMFISAIFYLYCSLKPDGSVDRRDMLIVVAMLTGGLLCGKAKYFASFIIAIYFLFIYKPGLMKHFSVKHAILLALIFGTIMAAAWSKINYYFITGNSENFDPTVVESFARPVMYATGTTIIGDHFPFGTGLASFGTAASSMNYSMVYYEYGIHNVHGISQRSESSFIVDAFYPSLAQFGAVGLVLFVVFWFYAYNFLRKLIRQNYVEYKYPFVIGSLIICFILVESTAATTFTHNSGIITMSLLGLICGKTFRTHEALHPAEPALESPLKPTQPSLQRI